MSKDSDMDFPATVSWVGHRIREARVHLERLSQSSGLPSIAFSVTEENNGFSSGLRGFAVAEELRKLGWRSIVLPKQLELSQRQRILRWEETDILVLQKSRHPLNRPKYYQGTTCVFDIDDADFVNPAFRDSTIECLQGSQHIIAGSRYVAEFSRRHNAAVDIVWTGSYPRKRHTARKAEPPAVAWAISDVSHYSGEFELVMDALARVRNRNWQFWLFGANDTNIVRPKLTFLTNNGIQCRTFPFMRYKQFLATLQSAAIGLAPLVPSASTFSAGKSFGKVLGYLDCRAAIVASNTADHPLFFRHGINGLLVSSTEELSENVDLLLSDPSLRQRISAQAHRDYLEQLSIRAVTRQLDAILRPLVRD
jgi:hypothetical protein